jgi:hypothetical protein
MAVRKTPALPDATPAVVGIEPVPYTSHQDHSFTLQAIMELQKSVGALEAKQDTLIMAIREQGDRVEKTLDRIGERIGKVEKELSEITKKIYAASAILAFLVAVGAFFVDKAWDMATIHLPGISQIVSPPKGE